MIQRSRLSKHCLGLRLRLICSIGIASLLIMGCGSYTVRGVPADSYNLLNDCIEDTAHVYRNNEAQYQHVWEQLGEYAKEENVSGYQAIMDQYKSEFDTSNTELIAIRDDLVALRKSLGWYEGPRHAFQDVIG